MITKRKLKGFFAGIMFLAVFILTSLGYGDRPSGDRHDNDTEFRGEDRHSNDRGNRSGRVILYEHENFRGARMVLNAGDSIRNFDHLRMRDGRRWNDQVSSMRVEGSVRVEIFRDANFRGQSFQVRNSISNFHHSRGLSGFNDSLSSIRVNSAGHDVHKPYSDRHSGGRVILYEHAGFQGSSVELQPGQSIYDLSRLRRHGRGNWNDIVSSIRIEGNLGIRVYRHAGFHGEGILLSRSINNFSDVHELRGFNDEISSIQVVRRSHLDRDDGYGYGGSNGRGNHYGSSGNEAAEVGQVIAAVIDILINGP